MTWYELWLFIHCNWAGLVLLARIMILVLFALVFVMVVKPGT